MTVLPQNPFFDRNLVISPGGGGRESGNPSGDPNTNFSCLTRIWGGGPPPWGGGGGRFGGPEPVLLML